MNNTVLVRPARRREPVRWNDRPFVPETPEPTPAPAAPLPRVEDDPTFDALYMRLGHALIDIGKTGGEDDDVIALMLERQTEFLDYAATLLSPRPCSPCARCAGTAADTNESVACAPMTRANRKHDRDTRRRVARKDGYSNSGALSELLLAYGDACTEHVNCADGDEPDAMERTFTTADALGCWIDARVRRARRAAKLD